LLAPHANLECKRITGMASRAKSDSNNAQVLARILSPEYRGPRASFGSAQVLKAILVTGRSSPSGIGRGRLGSELGLGQGEIRTLIHRMKDNGIITIESSGCKLTELGRKLYLEFQRKLPWSGAVDCSSLGLGRSCWAVLIRGKYIGVANRKKLNRGIEQRDAALLGGASSALTLVFKKGRFLIPVEETDAETPSAKSDEPWRTLRSANPEEGDVVIVGGSDEKLSSEYGALSAVLTLL